MSTREERAEESREWMRTYGRDCIGCHLGICDSDHDLGDNIDDFDMEDDE